MTEKNFINNAEEIIPPFNDSKYKRILVIGDVHAAYEKLTTLWEKISVTNNDLVIFHGDYLYGKGDKNIETLRWLIEHKRQKNIIFLRGNVDETYLKCLFDENGKFIGRTNTRVIMGIRNAAVKEPNFPNEVFDFLNGLPLNHSMTIGGKKYFLCHAGINVNAPLESQSKTYLLNHPKLKSFYKDYQGKAVIVVGHKKPERIAEKVPQLFTGENLDLTRPIKVPHRNILMLDTHAKEGGPLSCVDILSGQFWQVGGDVNSKIDSIIFVCSGNACRSPMAKYIMRHLTKNNVLIDSAGCKTRGGRSMSGNARGVLAANKIPFDNHISKPFTPQEYAKFKLVVALDKDMLQMAKKISGGDPDNKIRLLKDDNGNEISVNDPFHSDNPKKAYPAAYEKIFLGCSALLRELAL